MGYTTREVTVHGIYVHETKTWSLWLTETDGKGDQVVTGHCLGDEKRLLDRFGDLVRDLKSRSLPLPRGGRDGATDAILKSPTQS